MLNTDKSYQLYTQLRKIVDRQPALATQILQYVPGEYQLDIASGAKCQSLRQIIRKSRNLKSVSNLSSKFEQNIARNDNDAFPEFGHYSVWNYGWEIIERKYTVGDVVMIQTGLRPLKGVIINKTIGCVQHKDLFLDEQSHYVILLDLEFLADNISSWYGKTEELKHRNEVIQDVLSDHRDSPYPYVSNDSNNELRGVVRPSLHSLHTMKKF